jgi:hypothetical protein
MELELSILHSNIRTRAHRQCYLSIRALTRIRNLLVPTSHNSRPLECGPGCASSTYPPFEVCTCCAQPPIPIKSS